MKFILTLFVLTLIHITSYSQTSRLRIEAGGSVYFHFNSLNKLEAGITYSNWTQLSVYYVDTVTWGVPVPGSKWTLDVIANDSEIRSDNGSPSLDLRTIQLEANYLSGTTDAVVQYANTADLGILELSESAIPPLVLNGPQTTIIDGPTKVRITYHCGKNAGFKLMGKASDYYTVDVIFTLHKQ